MFHWMFLSPTNSSWWKRFLLKVSVNLCALLRNNVWVPAWLGKEFGNQWNKPVRRGFNIFEISITTFCLTTASRWQIIQKLTPRGSAMSSVSSSKTSSRMTQPIPRSGKQRLGLRRWGRQFVPMRSRNAEEEIRRMMMMIMKMRMEGKFSTKKKSPVSGQIDVSAFYLFINFFAKKWCPITAQIAGLIGILSCCVLNDFYTGVWTLPDLCGLALATIICVWEIWSGSNTCIYIYHVFHWLAPKKRLPKKKVGRKGRQCTDLEADLSPETGDFFFALICHLLCHFSLGHPLCFLLC